MFQKRYDRKRNLRSYRPPCGESVLAEQERERENIGQLGASRNYQL